MSALGRKRTLGSMSAMGRKPTFARSPPPPQLPLPFRLGRGRHRQRVRRRLLVHEIEIQALAVAPAAAEPCGHVAQPIAPALPAEQPPDREPVEHLRAPAAAAGELEVIAASRRVEELAQRIGRISGPFFAPHLPVSLRVFHVGRCDL
jgi:hypothetical protein